jgi:hypothetical protein
MNLSLNTLVRFIHPGGGTKKRMLLSMVKTKINYQKNYLIFTISYLKDITTTQKVIIV